MLILLDNNAPRGLARALVNHTVIEARERGWATLKNGELLIAAEQAGFDVLFTADKSIQYQQNLKELKIAIIVLTQLRWRLIRKKLTAIAETVNAAGPGSFAEVEIPFE